MYNDEPILSIEEYQKLAKAYSKELQNKGFMFVAIDKQKEKLLSQKAVETLHQIKGLIFSLSGFMGTGALYGPTVNHIKILSSFCSFSPSQTKKFSRDKTKGFLNLISLENSLLGCLSELLLNSPNYAQILEIIEERTFLQSKLYQVD